MDWKEKRNEKNSGRKNNRGWIDVKKEGKGGSKEKMRKERMEKEKEERRKGKKRKEKNGVMKQRNIGKN